MPYQILQPNIKNIIKPYKFADSPRTSIFCASSHWKLKTQQGGVKGSVSYGSRLDEVLKMSER